MPARKRCLPYLPQEIDDRRTRSRWNTSSDATDDRSGAIAQLIRNGIDLVLIYDNTKIDMFFLEKFKNIVEFEREVKAHPMDVETLRDAKRMGFSDKFIGQLWSISQQDVYRLREKNGLFPVYKMIDTCASEFSSMSSYFYR